MKKSLFLLFSVIIFLGFASPVLADLGGGCAVDGDCFMGPQGQQVCRNGTCVNPAAATNGFSINLPNPLCLSGDKCSTAVAECDNGAWRTSAGAYESLAQCCAEFGSTTSTAPCINDFPSLIAKISSYIIGVIGSLAVIMIIWAGILFVTAGANPSNVEKAKKVLLYAIIGIAISLAGAGLVAVIKAVLNV
jgi:hypothetical protein